MRTMLLPGMALVIAVIALVRSFGTHPEEKDTSAEEVHALRIQVDRLQGEVRALTTKAPSGADAGRAPPAAAGDPNLLARVARIEGSLEAIQARVGSQAPAAPAPEARRPAPPKGPEEHVTILVDSRQPSAERLAAVKALRGRAELNEDRVVDALAAWIPAESDATVRADVIRNLGNPTNQRLVDALIEVLRRDADATVREEAAETLGKNRTATGVQDALTDASTNDSDPKVRAQAAASAGIKEAEDKPK